MNVILIAVIVLGAVGLVAALVLFVASKKFAVWEDPRIKQVSEVLPQANCGVDIEEEGQQEDKDLLILACALKCIAYAAPACGKDVLGTLDIILLLINLHKRHSHAHPPCGNNDKGDHHCSFHGQADRTGTENENKTENKGNSRRKRKSFRKEYLCY